jgi:hypothetical protein
VDFDLPAVPDFVRSRDIAGWLLVGSIAAFAWPTETGRQVVIRGRDGIKEVAGVAMFAEPRVALGLLLLIAAVAVWYLSTRRGGNTRN